MKGKGGGPGKKKKTKQAPRRIERRAIKLGNFEETKKEKEWPKNRGIPI